MDNGWKRFLGLFLDFVRGIFITHEIRPSVSVRISAISFVSLNIKECNTMAVKFVNMLLLSCFLSFYGMAECGSIHFCLREIAAIAPQKY